MRAVYSVRRRVYNRFSFPLDVAGVKINFFSFLVQKKKKRKIRFPARVPYIYIKKKPKKTVVRVLL